MIELTLTIVGLAGAMTVPAFLTAIVESTASKLRPASVASHLAGRPQMKFVLVNGRTPRPHPGTGVMTAPCYDAP